MTREQLIEETVQADVSCLLQYLANRTREGNVKPITTLEALEAMHRRQPPTGIIPAEAAHAARVMERVRNLIQPSQSI